MRKPDGQTLILGGVIVAILAAGAYLLLSRNGQAEAQPRSRLRLADIPFDGARSYAMLKTLCDLGPRFSGSPGMQRQQALLKGHFEQLGATVQMQKFAVRHPEDGSRVELANMIVQWHPRTKERILLCAHYDTRPYPDSDPDPRRRKGTFVGANDGASGTALLAEMAYSMPTLKSKYGVDFVLFDGEELVYDSRRDAYFLGSTEFANQYRQQPPAHRYKFGVLLDMVGDKELQLYQEQNSRRYARDLVADIWKTAEELRVREFIPRVRHEVRDDHLPLNQIARIPTCDIIDFDYPRVGTRMSYWHTEADTPDKCSALSLAKVGWVVREWLERVE